MSNFAPSKIGGKTLIDFSGSGIRAALRVLETPYLCWMLWSISWRGQFSIDRSMRKMVYNLFSPISHFYKRSLLFTWGLCCVCQFKAGALICGSCSSAHVQVATHPVMLALAQRAFTAHGAGSQRRHCSWNSTLGELCTVSASLSATLISTLMLLECADVSKWVTQTILRCLCTSLCQLLNTWDGWYHAQLECAWFFHATNYHISLVAQRKNGLKYVMFYNLSAIF